MVKKTTQSDYILIIEQFVKERERESRVDCVIDCGIQDMYILYIIIDWVVL